MYSKYYFSPLTVVLALGLTAPLQAAQPIFLQKTSFNEIQKKYNLTKPGQTRKSVNSSTNANGLQLLAERTDINKVVHVRMQQQYAGYPVIGGYAILHTKQGVKALSGATSSSSVQMNGTLYEGLEKELGQPDAAFVANGKTVLEQFKTQYAGLELSEEQIIPVVYIDDQDHAHWAYKVSVLVNHTDQIPERPTAILDAKSHKPFAQWNSIKTALSPVKGIGFGGNNKVGEYQFGKELPLLDITRNNKKQMCFMENKDVKVVDMMHRYSGANKAMSFSCEKNPNDPLAVYYTGYDGDGYDKDNGAMSPTNDALYAGYVIKHMYHDWYGVDALTQSNGSPMKLTMRVHYGQYYDNAYWDGKQMTFGDGDDSMYPLVSLGVGAHEVSHGFTEQHSNLEYYGQSGGMNEAFSDMAAQAAEFYSLGKSSWQIGAEIMKEDSGYDALRYMDKPSRDGSSIDTADEYYGGLDVHYSSGVYNHLFYILANQPKWDVRQAFDVMVKANMDYWTPYSSFKDGGCGLLSAAKDLKLSVSDVKKSLDQVKINYEACTTNN